MRPTHAACRASNQDDLIGKTRPAGPHRNHLVNPTDTINREIFNDQLVLNLFFQRLVVRSGDLFSELAFCLIDLNRIFWCEELLSKCSNRLFAQEITSFLM